MISSDVIRGYNDTIILFMLQDEPSYGYEISRKIREISEDKYVIKETTLYSAFTRMEKNDYIESFSQTGENGKKRTYYKITDKGKDYYQEKCDEWSVTKEVIDKFVSNDEFVLGTDVNTNTDSDPESAAGDESEENADSGTGDVILLGTSEEERRDTDGSTGGISE